MITVPVRVGDRATTSSSVPGARRRVCPSVIPPRAKRVAVVTQATVPLEVEPGVEHRVFVIGDGEAAKSLATVEELCRDFARWGLTRGDVVVVGRRRPGHRRRRLRRRRLPPGRRGRARRDHAARDGRRRDRRQDGREPARGQEPGRRVLAAVGVLCDTDALATLPPREYRSGLGEMAKYHFLTGDDLMATAARRAQSRAACAIKAAVVADDEREETAQAPGALAQLRPHAGPRARDRRRYDLRHGEAVAIGLVFAAELACGARAHRRRPGRRPPRACVGGLRPAARRCRPASTPTSSSR